MRSVKAPRNSGEEGESRKTGRLQAMDRGPPAGRRKGRESQQPASPLRIRSRCRGTTPQQLPKSAERHRDPFDLGRTHVPATFHSVH